MSTIFKSSSAFSGSSLYPPGFLAYIQRVKADGGTIGNVDAVFEIYRQMERGGIALANAKVLVSPAFGYQKLVGGEVTKLYNLSNANDFTISGSRAGTGPFYSTLNGYPEIIFADVAGSGQKALSTSFAATPFTFTNIYTGMQARLDSATVSPARAVTWMNSGSNTATSPRSPEPLVVALASKFDQIGNGLSVAPAGSYTGRAMFGASAFAKVSPSTSSRRRLSNGRMALVDSLTTTGAFDAGAGFNGNIYAYSGVSTGYDQAAGYGLGAAMVMIDITDTQWFDLRDKINAVTS